MERKFWLIWFLRIYLLISGQGIRPPRTRDADDAIPIVSFGILIVNKMSHPSFPPWIEPIDQIGQICGSRITSIVFHHPYCLISGNHRRLAESTAAKRYRSFRGTCHYINMLSGVCMIHAKAVHCLARGTTIPMSSHARLVKSTKVIGAFKAVSSVTAEKR